MLREQCSLTKNISFFLNLQYVIMQTMSKEIALKWYKQALHDLYKVYNEEIARDKVERAKKIFREVKKKCRELKEMES